MKPDKNILQEKKKYLTPEVECINLDNEISLQLQSTPPLGPGELSQVPEYFNNDPYNNIT